MTKENTVVVRHRRDNTICHQKVKCEGSCLSVNGGCDVVCDRRLESTILLSDP